MKTVAKLAVAMALGTASIAPAVAQYGSGSDVCLDTYYIDSTHVVDAKTIVFKMKDGTKWRNDLPVACNGLLFDGFTYRLNYPEICSTDHLPITILRSHEVCQLGGFTKVMPSTHT